MPASALRRPSFFGVGPPGLIASAPGFGKGWIEEPRLDSETIIKLVAAGPIIEGRLINEAHDPVVGATVRLTELRVPINIPEKAEPANLTPFLTRRDSSFTLDLALRQYAVTGPTVTTDDEGRFRIEGVGPERVVVLVANGPTFATTRIFVGTRVTMVAAVESKDWQTPITVYPPRFEVVVKATQPITGVITDGATGRPLPGWRVSGNSGSIWLNSKVIPVANHNDDDLATTSDEQGRYTLTGLPPGKDRWVYFNPPRGQPFLNAGRRLNSPPEEAGATTPLTCDLAAERGIVVRGQVTDQRTGNPITGHIVAGGMRSNPYLNDHPDYASSRIDSQTTDKDGRYEVVVPPGPGIVAFVAEDENAYQRALGAEAIPGIVPPFTNKASAAFETIGVSIAPYSYNVLAGVEPLGGDPDLTVNLVADPWRSIALKVVGPDDQPLTTLMVDGTLDQAFNGSNRGDQSTVMVRRLALGEPRRVTVRDRERHLAGSIVLDAAANGADLVGSARVELVPWGEIRGRIIDLAGMPRSDFLLAVDSWNTNTSPTGPYLLPPRYWLSSSGFTNQQGDFAWDSLVPGLPYKVGVTKMYGQEPFDVLVESVIVKPGERKELGTLTVHPPARTAFPVVSIPTVMSGRGQAVAGVVRLEILSGRALDQSSWCQIPVPRALTTVAREAGG